MFSVVHTSPDKLFTSGSHLLHPSILVTGIAGIVCQSSFRTPAQLRRRHQMLDVIAAAQVLLIHTMVPELLYTDSSGLIPEVIILCYLSHIWWHC